MIFAYAFTIYSSCCLSFLILQFSCTPSVTDDAMVEKAFKFDDFAKR